MPTTQADAPVADAPVADAPGADAPAQPSARHTAGDSPVASASSATLSPAPTAPVRPRGIGVAVTFDWALTAQMLFLIPQYARGVGAGAPLTTATPGVGGAAALLLLIPAALTFAFGEAMRRGWRLAWRLQIALNAALTVVGLFEAPGDIAAALHAQPGFFSDLVRLAVLVIIDPIIVVMLTRPATRAWIAHHSVAEARARHGGWWLVIVIPFAILGGAAIAFNGLY